MPRPQSQRSELSQDLDPIGDALITILLARMGVRVPGMYRGVDAATDMLLDGGFIPPEFAPDPRVQEFYADAKTKVKGAVKKKKRKVSKYQREFGRSMKTLIKKHPRTARTKLMSRAHKLTRRNLK